MLASIRIVTFNIYRQCPLATTISSRFAVPSFPFSRKIDFSRVPVLNESDLEEKLVLGNGPGGQAVNKTSNCVELRHKPTNIVVKCHIHRVTEQNRKEARTMLIAKLDGIINGDQSVKSQRKAIGQKNASVADRKRKKLNEMKLKWKERETGSKTDGDIS